MSHSVFSSSSVSQDDYGSEFRSDNWSAFFEQTGYSVDDIISLLPGDTAARLRRSLDAVGEDAAADILRVNNIVKSLRRHHQKKVAAERALSDSVAKGCPQAPGTSNSGWARKVFRMHGQVCFMSGDRAVSGHHIIEKKVIRWELGSRLSEQELGRVVGDPRNGMPVSQRVHDCHHNGGERIPRGFLPGTVWAFAAELDARYDTDFIGWLHDNYR